MPSDRHRARGDALLDLLAGERLDGLIVAHPANIRYLTGFSGTAGLAVVLRQETILLTDFRYGTQAETEVGEMARIEVAPTDLWDRLWKVLSDYAGLHALGFEAHVISAADAERFGSVDTPVRFRPVRELIERLRVCKDQEEVQAIREAARLAGEALEATLQCVRVGQSERDIAAMLEHELRRRGSEWHPFHTIVASGPRSALPHAVPSSREVARGDCLLLDFGAQVDGYCADITRTVVVGSAADERQRAIYDLVREAQLHARRHIRGGMIGKEADGLARSIIEARGFGDAFGHSLGHGLGLEVHEAPRVSKANDQPLPVGAVVTLEPGVYVPGWGGVRIEDNVYLGEEHAELLSDGDTELRELK